jgi:uncharacterized protein (DUF1800 family)
MLKDAQKEVPQDGLELQSDDNSNGLTGISSQNTSLASTGSKLSISALGAIALAACGAGLEEEPGSGTTPSPSPAAGGTPSPSPAGSPSPNPSPSPTSSASPSPSPSPAGSPSPAPSPAGSPTPAPSPTPAGPPAPGGNVKPGAAEAARFLNQATFGATQAKVNTLSAQTYNDWFNAQINKPRTECLPLARAVVKSGTFNNTGRNGTSCALVKMFATAQDDFRMRIAYCLSQYFVVSLIPGAFTQEVALGAAYFDVLSKNAFGNFRTLLEEVSLSPAMGVYLSHVKNKKEDPATGRLPDENYAREVMQLFTIGLNQLNQDGTLKLDSQGNPIETYTNADITGLAKVFTGWSWNGVNTSDLLFDLAITPSKNGDLQVGHTTTPMQSFPQFTSTSEKKFLGVTIPAKSQADGPGDLKIALDTLFNHPNTAPFFCKQMIQRLVTSNPSPNYVKRVADVFVNDGTGKRGNLAAVFRAILLDGDARNPAPSNTSGKIKEPVLRFYHALTALGGKSKSTYWKVRGSSNTVGDTSVMVYNLGHFPLWSPSVFNDFQPDYIPTPTSFTGAQNLKAPEMQITSESTVATYMNIMRMLFEAGVGDGNDVTLDFANQLPLANNPEQLVNNMNLLFADSKLTGNRKQLIIDAVAGVSDPLNRCRTAAYLTMMAPEAILQN